MTFNIPLSPESAAKLRELAAEAGKDVESLIREAVEDKLWAMKSAPGDDGMSAEQWSAQWHAWAASHPQLDYVAADSRASVYAGRGE